MFSFASPEPTAAISGWRTTPWARPKQSASLSRRFLGAPCNIRAGTIDCGVQRLEKRMRHANLDRHIVKTTIEIADDLFERAQELARKERTSFRSLTEQGLRLVLDQKRVKSRRLPPL